MLGNEILKMLCQEISQNEIDNYISRLKYNKKDSDTQNEIFIAPNDLIAKFIQTKFAKKIAHLFEVKTGLKPNVIITSQKNENTQIKVKKIDVRQVKQSAVNENYTFENFIVGESNFIAYNHCQQAAKNIGVLVNPIFIYGSTGLGKTHLLHSVGNYCLANGSSVIYVTSEQFAGDFSNHMRNNSLNRFKEKYRNCDVLLIDDVQFLGKTDAIQDEFFYTFEEISQKNGQIIMTSDEPPKNLKGFRERLISRFSWGLIANITPPELETKIKIIKTKCEFNKIELNSDIVNYIATKMGDNIREIEGAIININAFGNVMGQKQEITLEFAKGVLEKLIRDKLENISVESIINFISSQLNIKVSDIKSRSKTKNIVEARRICIYLAKTLTPNSMPQLAEHFGLKDHSSVSHTIKKINELMEKDSLFKLKIEEYKNKLATKVGGKNSEIL